MPADQQVFWPGVPHIKGVKKPAHAIVSVSCCLPFFSVNSTFVVAFYCYYFFTLANIIAKEPINDFNFVTFFLKKLYFFR